MQTKLQEKDLTASQQETIYKTEMTDLNEMMGRLNSELAVQHERLDKTNQQVRGIVFVGESYW